VAGGGGSDVEEGAAVGHGRFLYWRPSENLFCLSARNGIEINQRLQARF
jgi:hypothetical protein